MKVDKASRADLLFIDHLQRKNAEDLAFYPKTAFEREIDNGRIILAWVNGEAAGYLYHGAFKETLLIHQACIEYDLRGQLYGAALVNFLTTLAEGMDVCTISLRCGSDILANGFWRAMGFVCVSVTKGGVRRMRDINTWHKNLQPILFQPDSVTPSDKKKDASLWTRQKNKGNLSGNRFLRGSALDEYRESLERAEHE